MKRLTRYFFQGLLILFPVVTTLYLSFLVFEKLNRLLFARLGQKVDDLVGGAAPGATETILGIVVTVALITVVGIFASNVLGRWLVKLVERILEHVPLVKLLYGALRDLLGAFVGDKKGFDHPVVVGLDEAGVTKVVGFVTQRDLEFLGIRDHVAVYLPQSYNFAGNLIVVPAARVAPLPASSSDVMTFLVSGGVSATKAAS